MRFCQLRYYTLHKTLLFYKSIHKHFFKISKTKIIEKDTDWNLLALYAFQEMIFQS